IGRADENGITGLVAWVDGDGGDASGNRGIVETGAGRADRSWTFRLPASRVRSLEHKTQGLRGSIAGTIHDLHADRRGFWVAVDDWGGQGERQPRRKVAGRVEGGNVENTRPGREVWVVRVEVAVHDHGRDIAWATIVGDPADNRGIRGVAGERRRAAGA